MIKLGPYFIRGHKPNLGSGWFYFTDGHFGFTDDFQKAHAMRTLDELHRCWKLCLADGGIDPTAIRKVHMRWDVYEIEDFEQALKDHYVQKVIDKLSPDEFLCLKTAVERGELP